MPAYIHLGKLTDEGMKNVKDAPAVIEATVKAIEEAGGKVIGFYSTMGQYDCAIITEFPSDEVVMAGLLALGSQGTLRTTTLKAFPANEFAEIVKKLP